MKSSCQSGGHGRLNYLPCLSCASLDPIFCKILTRETASCNSMSSTSEVEYGASSYLRGEYPDGRIYCTFVMGKARNAPVKFVSIPRLELQAAVLATRVCKMLREELELNIDRTFFWTDSEIVLHYPKNEKQRLQTFVANRVEEIKEHSPVHYWNHVESCARDFESRRLYFKDIDPIFSDR